MELITLINYQQCALYASRAYVLKDNQRYTISLNNALCMSRYLTFCDLQHLVALLVRTKTDGRLK